MSPSNKGHTAIQGETEFTEQTGESWGESPNTGGSGEKNENKNCTVCVQCSVSLSWFSGCFVCMCCSWRRTQNHGGDRSRKCWQNWVSTGMALSGRPPQSFTMFLRSVECSFCFYTTQIAVCNSVMKCLTRNDFCFLQRSVSESLYQKSRQEAEGHKITRKWTTELFTPCLPNVVCWKPVISLCERTLFPEIVTSFFSHIKLQSAQMRPIKKVIHTREMLQIII